VHPTFFQWKGVPIEEPLTSASSVEQSVAHIAR
jgi:hypothetical protein